MQSFFSNLQKVGQAFMLPVAVLPVAGILLGVGAAKLPFMPAAVSTIMEASGGAIFGVLPLIFAVAVAIAFAKQDKGVAGLASIVGFYVFLGSLGATAAIVGVKTKLVLGVSSVDTGVVGGIVVGALAVFLHNRYHDIKLPEFLGFFSGRRFVPIVVSLGATFLGILFAFVWPPIGSLIEKASYWAAYSNPKVAFSVYAFVERLLVPTGLHHIWNVPFFFEVGSYTTPSGDVVRGEITRYLAGDPTAGNLAGSYLFKMYGLPAAAIAIALNARPENRKAVMSLMLSAALTSFLTGITEPIEFSFLFVAPILYGIHAVLAAVGYLIVLPLGIKHGTTFSHGLIDYVVLYSKSTNGWMLIPLGLAYGAVYFVIFTVVIRALNLKTPGREEKKDDSKEDTSTVATSNIDTSNVEIGEKLVIAYGGADNLVNLDACITRLRITVKDKTKVNQDALKAMGAKGCLIIGDGVQAVFGGKSEAFMKAMKAYINKNK